MTPDQKQITMDKDAAIRFALEHVSELRDAWMRGALSEHDGLGGTRSNRNIEVEKALRAALSSPDVTGESAAKREGSGS